MATPVSTSTAYCTVAQSLAYHDERQWGDALADNDVRVPSGSLAGNATFGTLLMRASGDIEAACFVGERYSPTDLAALTGAGLELLKGLCAELAFWYAKVRRTPNLEMPESTKWAFETLERIRKGEAVLGLQENQEAGLPAVEFTTQQHIDTIRLTTTVGRRFFGERVKERRLGP